MIENLKTVSNPLTVVAGFSALAEMAGTIALPLVSEELQGMFVWFVMGFPILLVALFFATLNFNHKVLYAPSDFSKEENFMLLIKEREQLVDERLHEIKDSILKDAEELKQKGVSPEEEMPLRRSLEKVETQRQRFRDENMKLHDVLTNYLELLKKKS